MTTQQIEVQQLREGDRFQEGAHAFVAHDNPEEVAGRLAVKVGSSTWLHAEADSLVQLLDRPGDLGRITPDALVQSGREQYQEVLDYVKRWSVTDGGAELARQAFAVSRSEVHGRVDTAVADAWRRAARLVSGIKAETFSRAAAYAEGVSYRP